MPKQSKAKWNIDTDNFVVNLEILSNGDKVAFDLNDLSDEIVNQLALHGAKQLLGDSFSAKDTEPAESTAKKWATLSAGDWSAKREGLGPRISMLVEAVAQTSFGEGKTLSEIATMIEKMAEADKKFKTNLGKNKDVAPILKRLRAERAAAAAAKAEAETSDDTTEVSALFA